MPKKVKDHLLFIESYHASIALIVALAGTLLACWQIYDSRKVSEAQMYLAMRDRYFDVAEKLRGHEDVAITRNSESWVSVKNYWYVSFDEWYVTRKINVFPDLWSTYYSEAFARALKRAGFRSVFCELRTTDFSSGIRQEFVKEVEDAYENQVGEKIPCT